MFTTSGDAAGTGKFDMNIEKIVAGIIFMVLGIWTAKNHIQSLRQGKSDTLGGHISLVFFGIALAIGGIMVLIINL